MFSSVRNAEHVRNAINLGVHTITVPWKIMKALTENNFTALGTQQFIEHTRLMTVKVKDAINKVNPIVTADTSLSDAIVKMTEFGFGAVTVTNGSGQVLGVFTDGDLRRKLQQDGRNALGQKMSHFKYNPPISVHSNSLLTDTAHIFNKSKL